MKIELQELLRSGLREGHFPLASGEHTGLDFQGMLLLERPEQTAELAGLLVERFRGAGITRVVAMGAAGLVLGQEVARLLGSAFAAAMQAHGVMRLVDGSRVLPEDRVLLVTDRIQTGATVQALLELLGGSVHGVAAIMDCSGGSAELPVQVYALATNTSERWKPADCPLCARGTPLWRPRRG